MTQQSEREMLEAAAKSVGYDISNIWNAWRMQQEPPIIALWIDGVSTGWNPLTDDGHNRRLQVKLKLGLVPLEGGGWDCIKYDEDGDEITLASDFDPNRAVVRAAAQIGATATKEDGT